ncbi:MAG: TIGR02452 family protein, partial [Planctomycetota bacterium]
MSRLQSLPCIDSHELAQKNQRLLQIRHEIAESLGRSALEAIDQGWYLADCGKVDWSKEVATAESASISISPDDSLPSLDSTQHDVTQVTVTNSTTLSVSHELVANGQNPLALNFANGVEPGGGFLRGATAQEETLCRSSALYATLFGDRMYEFHRDNDPGASSDW